jgi:ankyrin repeat protein
VQLLLEHKADIESNDGSYGRTPLSYAAGNGHEAIVRLLLDTGRVEAHSKDSNGRTPLVHATKSGSEAIILMLQKYTN